MTELFRHKGIPQSMCDECKYWSEYGCTAMWCDYRKKEQKNE